MQRVVPLTKSKVGRACTGVLAMGVLFASVAFAQSSDTQIKLQYGIKATWAENPNVPGVKAGLSGISRHNVTIVLKKDGEISEAYQGSGKFVLVKKNDAVLGADGATLQYKVIDENTIQRISTSETHVQSITVRVAGRSCSMQFEIALKPGKQVYVAFSQSKGQPLNYRSFELADSSCAIE